MLTDLIKLDDEVLSKYILNGDKNISFTIFLLRDCFLNILPNLYELSNDLHIIKTDDSFYENVLKLLKNAFQILTLQQLFENDFIIKIFDFILNNLNSTLRCSEVSLYFIYFNDLLKKKKKIFYII